MDIDVKWMLTINNLTFDDDSEVPLLHKESSNQKTRADFLPHIFIWGKYRKNVGREIS